VAFEQKDGDSGADHGGEQVNDKQDVVGFKALASTDRVSVEGLGGEALRGWGGMGEDGVGDSGGDHGC
jgi:hypothetical protein